MGNKRVVKLREKLQTKGLSAFLVASPINRRYLSGFTGSGDAAYANKLIEVFRLPMKRLVKRLSRGMLSSVGIIVGLASRAPVTIFDEPYLGLDAVARELFYDHLIEDYTNHPRTIILSTHLIDEVSRLLEHLAGTIVPGFPVNTTLPEEATASRLVIPCSAVLRSSSAERISG